MKEQVTSQAQSRTKRDESMLLLASGSPFLEFTITAKEWCHPLWTHLPTSMIISQIILYRQAHRPASQAIL